LKRPTFRPGRCSRPCSKKSSIQIRADMQVEIDPSTARFDA
jgi:hypothetical protein